MITIIMSNLVLKHCNRNIISESSTLIGYKFISTIIRKDNLFDTYLKSVRRHIDLNAFFGPSAEEVVQDTQLANKTCLITGANGGIGLELTRCLSLHNCNVLMACRNRYKANLLARKTCENHQNLKLYEVNLSSLASVKNCADKIIQNEKKVDIIILNAATFGIPWTLTEDGLETTFQVNFLSQYYLLLCLGKILAPDVRVVLTSSESHRNVKWPNEFNSSPVLEYISLPKDKYTSIKSYNISKLCGLMIMHYLSRQWAETRRGVFCAHPGSFIKTGLCRNWWVYEALYTIMLPFSKSIVQGASTILYCATSPDLQGQSALYFNNCRRCEESELAKNIYITYKVHDLIHEIFRDRTHDFENVINNFKKDIVYKE